MREAKQLAFRDFSLKELRVRNCNAASAMRIARTRSCYRIFMSVIVNHFTAEIQVHELDLQSLLVAALLGVPVDPPNAFRAARPSRRVVGKDDRFRH